MKICVTAVSGNLDAKIDPRFGRCQYFVIVDTETMNFETMSNMASGAMGGAGIQAAQTVAHKDVQAVLTGSVGPNAFQVLSAAGIDILTGGFGTIREAVEKFKRGQLQRTAASIAPMGSGMGMGREYRQATWPFAPQAPMNTIVSPPVSPQMSKEQARARSDVEKG